MIVPSTAASRQTDWRADPRTLELLRLVWRGGKYAYFWRLSDKWTNWVDVRHFAGLLDIFGPKWQQDAFFGVHPCRDFRTADERGRIEDVSAIACAFADVDATDGETVSDLLTRIGKLSYQPSAVIASGAGLHCYWLLRNPIAVDSEATRRELAEFQRAFSRWAGGDRNASDLARVLRVPGTWSTKRKCWVKWVEFTPDRTYSYQELRKVVMAQPQQEHDKPASTRVKEGKCAIGGVIRWLAGQRPGNRNCATYWAAHRLREAGVTHEHAQALLVPIATGLGLPEREAARTIASAYGGGQ